MALHKSETEEEAEVGLAWAIEGVQFGVERKEERNWRGSQEGERSRLYTHTHTHTHTLTH